MRKSLLIPFLWHSAIHNVRYRHVAMVTYGIRFWLVRHRSTVHDDFTSHVPDDLPASRYRPCFHKCCPHRKQDRLRQHYGCQVLLQISHDCATTRMHRGMRCPLCFHEYDVG